MIKKNMQTINRKNGMQLAGAVMAWISVIIQFILMINNRVAPIPETVIRFFSFFTILTNTLVAITFTSLIGMPGNKWKRFFSKTATFTAITVYIVLVGIVYNLVLRWQWQPTGLQKWVDEMLHLVIPLFVLIYWYFFVLSSDPKWKDALRWMWYPFVYCIYILIRGSFSDFYPYPFMNVNELGYTKVLINCVYVTLAFFAVAVLLIGIGKMTGKKDRKSVV